MLIKKDKNDVKTLNLDNYDFIGIKMERETLWNVVAIKEVLVPITRGFLFWKKLEYKQELIEHIIWNCPDRDTAVKIKNQIDIAWTENYKMYYINGKE